MILRWFVNKSISIRKLLREMLKDKLNWVKMGNSTTTEKQQYKK
jgi:hypothetical protein